MSKKSDGPKILFIDIETSPLISYTWGIWDQNIALNQIYKDWNIIAWAAKWQDSSEIMYMDQRKGINEKNEKKLLQEMWKLMDEADIIVGQNSKKFDTKKLNSKFLLHKMQPPSSYKQIDTLQLAKKHFSMTSNKLEFLSDKLNIKYKKLKHDKYPGFELWKEVMNGNQSAWKEMEKYNKFDVLATEELYTKIRAWDNSINFNVYREEEDMVCTCGSKNFKLNGFSYTSVGKYRRYKCKDCSSELKSRFSELTLEKRKSLKTGTVR